MRDALAIVDLSGNSKAFLEATEIAFTRRWCGGSTLDTVAVDVRDPKASELSVGNRAFKLWLDGTLRFHGKIGTGQAISSKAAGVNAPAADPWYDLMARTLQADETYTSEDAGAIAVASLATENARGTTGLVAGTVATTVPRTITFTAGTSRADLVAQLSQLDQGFGFSVDPVDGVAGTRAALNIYATMVRNVRDGIRFEFGAGTKANCTDFEEQIAAPRNRVIATGQALPDGTRPQAVAEDTASQAEYGLWEYVVSLNTTDSAVLAAHAQAELRPDPITSYTMTANPDAPLLCRDFDVGDVVNIAIRHGRVQAYGPMRVDSATLHRKGSVWTTDSLTLVDQGVQRVIRARDERFYEELRSYRNRIAVIERARVVGS